MPTMNDRVRDRLKEEAQKRKLSQRDLAGFLQWTLSKVSKKLNGYTMIDLNELEALCFAVGITPTEAVRDRGLEFCAEMTPTELRVLEQIRKLSKPTFDAYLQVLQVQPKTSDVEPRGATRRKKA